MHSVTPSSEPLDAAAPRLIACMEAVILGLKQRGVSVETNQVFLLDRSDHAYLVPQALDGFPIQMSFFGSVPPWTDILRYHLETCFFGQRRWSMFEPPNGFNVERIVERLLSQLDTLKREQAERTKVADAKALAEGRLAELSTALDLLQKTPTRLQEDNLTIEGLPDFPDEVEITVRTSHANAEKIAREFRISGKRKRKP